MEYNILIGTPAYNGQLHLDYLNSLLGLTNKIKFSVMGIGNESLITRARNNIITYFYNNTQFTHLLFIDADIGINPEDIVKLVKHNKDVIGALVPMKGIIDGKKQYNITEVLGQENNLYKVKHIGTAVFLLSRKAVEDLINKAETYVHKGIESYNIFKVGVVDNIYLSEDFWVCEELRKLGYDIFVDDKIIVQHNGMYKF